MPTTVEPAFRSSRYTTGAIVLHWAIALLIIAQIIGGWAMHEFLENGTQLQYDVYQLHKSLGLTVLILTVARIMWRLFNPPPPEPASVSPLERRVSGMVHFAFYALMLLIPLSGWVMVTVSPIRVETVLYFQDWLPWPDVPLLAALRGSEAAEISEEVHAFLAYGAGVLVLLHVAGALKHHFEDGAFISRMSPRTAGDGPRNAYGHATTVALTGVFAVAIIGSAAYARYGGTADGLADAGLSPDQATVLASEAAAAGSPSRAGSAETATADPARWIVRPDESSLGFSVTMMGNEAGGSFADWDADIVFSPDALEASSITVTVGTDAVSLSGGGISQSQIEGPDGFANSDHGLAMFKADTIREAFEGDGYLAEGTLAIRGTEAPLTLPFTVDIDGDVARAEGSVGVERLTYDIGAENDPSGGTLSLTVDVSFTIVADRATDDGTVESQRVEANAQER